jgi:hypothetical protein
LSPATAIGGLDTWHWLTPDGKKKNAHQRQIGVDYFKSQEEVQKFIDTEDSAGVGIVGGEVYTPDQLVSALWEGKWLRAKFVRCHRELLAGGQARYLVQIGGKAWAVGAAEIKPLGRENAKGKAREVSATNSKLAMSTKNEAKGAPPRARISIPKDGTQSTFTCSTCNASFDNPVSLSRHKGHHSRQDKAQDKGHAHHGMKRKRRLKIVRSRVYRTVGALLSHAPPTVPPHAPAALLVAARTTVPPHARTKW